MSSSTGHIISFLEEETGFLFSEQKKKELSSFIKERMRVVRKNFPDLYLDHIRSLHGSGELMNLINCATVGETFFLRNKHHWQVLKKLVLPKIIDDNKNTTKKLKFWSAGCCTGEEAYTIAISLKEAFLFLENWDIKIIATDINQTSIEKAREGVYAQNSFRSVDPNLIEKYFKKERQHYRVREEIRKMVEFEKLNLVSQIDFPPHYNDCDVIFCRNVLMYFHPHIYSNVIKKFASSLKEEGFLFLGHAETSMAPHTVFKPIIYDTAFIFQKMTHEEQQSETRSQCAHTRQPAPVNPLHKMSNRHLTGAKQRIPLPRQTAQSGGQHEKNNLYPKGSRQSTTEGEVHTSTTDHYSGALSYYYQENFSAALDMLSRIKAENQNGVKILILKALIYINILDLTKAQDYHKQALQLSDVSPEVYLLEALIKEANEDYDGAIKANQAAIFLDNNFFTPHFRLIHIYQEKGKTKKASKNLTNALKALKTDDEERVKLFCGGFSKKLLEDICRRRSLL